MLPLLRTPSGDIKLVLGSWDGTSPSLQTKVLTRKIDWNTSVSLGNIGEDGLAAYHYPGDSGRAGSFWEWIKLPLGLKMVEERNATVRTIHFELK